MRDARMPNSPGSGRGGPTPFVSAPLFDVPDAELSAELKNWTGTAPALHPVGELLDRHWEAAFAYARLCTDGPRAAGMLTTAAFTRIFGESIRQAGPTSGWRPHLLVTVRRVAAEWDTDGQRELLHPELRSGTGERLAARLLPPPERRLLSRAFHRLPQAARALLWHSEVEAEPLAVPAALLGLSDDTARTELGRARERLRDECLQVHRELAPEQECRSYTRMLDVTYRRGAVDVDPDLREHLARCTQCRETADQLRQFDAGLLGVAIAEAVLGWGGRAYCESRLDTTREEAAPAEAAPPSAESVLAGGEPFETAAPRSAPAPANLPVPASRRTSRRTAHRAARRARRRNLALAVAAVGGLVVVPLVLWGALGSGHGSTDASGVEGKAAKPSSKPSWIGSGAASKGALRGRLHNVASGLCIAVTGGKALKDAEAELAGCSGAVTQQWSYESDGLLRSGADPGLCLDSHLAYSVQLESCTDAADRNVRYDFTLPGVLVPRWNQNLALTPAATDDAGALVLKTRTDATSQRWVIDTSTPDSQMKEVNWDADSTPAPVPSAAPLSAAPTTPRLRSAAAPAPTGTAVPRPEAGATVPDTPSCPAPGSGCGGDFGTGPGGRGGNGGGTGRTAR
ncbi:ricin-type beta-trefoil lectin domain protein [Streptomyces sp. NPDC047000]|uniref:ricin-type beta-trefoil lectin domain protein n=1 Tax=Streptomyces sp. NPDC047000 TaxID=3155474 RepID=UPI003403E74F